MISPLALDQLICTDCGDMIQACTCLDALERIEVLEASIKLIGKNSSQRSMDERFQSALQRNKMRLLEDDHGH